MEYQEFVGKFHEMMFQDRLLDLYELVADANPDYINRWDNKMVLSIVIGLLETRMLNEKLLEDRICILEERVNDLSKVIAVNGRN